MSWILPQCKESYSIIGQKQAQRHIHFSLNGDSSLQLCLHVLKHSPLLKQLYNFLLKFMFSALTMETVIKKKNTLHVKIFPSVLNLS